MEKAAWVDGRVTAGHQSSKVKNNLQLPESAPEARELGNMVVEALSRSHPDETWECSHLGGDRFAATMILFPHGLLYGAVPAHEADAIVDRYAAGRVDPRFLRGRTSVSTVAQAAIAFARDRSGDDGIDAYQVIGEHPHPHGWTVVLLHHGRRVVVEVGERMSAPLLSTCAATLAHPVREYTPVSVTG